MNKCLIIFLLAISIQTSLELSSSIDFKVIDAYIDELMTKSTTKFPAWNMERKLQGKESKWDYIDGCMILALLEIYSSTKESKYLTFSDSYIDYRVNEDGTINGYNKAKFNYFI